MSYEEQEGASFRNPCALSSASEWEPFDTRIRARTMYKRSPGLSWKRGKLYSKLKGSQYRFQDEIKIGA